MSDEFRPGVHEHYKSSPTDRRYYLVLGKARHTETDELLVAYVPLYHLEVHPGPRIQVRPYAMFLEQVKYQGKVLPRFKYIGQEL
jgi:hypothetical protein